MQHPYRFAFIALFILSAPAANAAAGAEQAKSFVDNVGKQVLEIINTSGASEDQKHARLQRMFVENVDIDGMAKFVLGRGWKDATPEQRSRYMQAYRKYLLNRYTRDFADYTGANYTITTAEDEGAGQYTIHMQIKASKQAEETDAGYRVRTGANDKFKITDIIVEGVSLITTERSEFASVMQQQGLDGLIKDIENKLHSDTKQQ